MNNIKIQKFPLMRNRDETVADLERITGIGRASAMMIFAIQTAQTIDPKEEYQEMQN